MDSLIFISPVVNKFLTFFRAIFGGNYSAHLKEEMSARQISVPCPPR